jgi:hypothetical protein
VAEPPQQLATLPAADHLPDSLNPIALEAQIDWPSGPLALKRDRAFWTTRASTSAEQVPKMPVVQALAPLPLPVTASCHSQPPWCPLAGY